MKKSLQALFSLIFIFIFAHQGWGQTTIFTESMGTVSSTTTLATHEANNGFDNDAFTMTKGDATNPADIRATSVSSGYTGASGSANVWFTSTNAQYGFAIEGINASSYTSLKLKFGYRKESSSALPTLALEYWNGSSWINVSFTFNESTNAGTGWYLSPTISLPVGAQISGLKLRWLKSGTVAVRIDDVVLTGTSSGSTPPTLTADITSNNVDNNINITFTDDATWRVAVTAVKIGGTALTVTTDYVITSGNIQLKPSGGNSLLTTSGSKNVTVEATGYTDASVTQQIDPGAATKLGITSQPTAPNNNGESLAQQPVIAIQDQYSNTVTTASNLVMASVGAGTWTLGGTTSKTAVSGVVTYSDLTATSLASVTGATISFTSSGLTGVTSNTFNIPAPVEIGWQITSTNSIFKIDFDNTVDGVNNGQFAGSGFQTSPSSGQLNSNAWAITGMSNGELTFGGSKTSDDYARGESSGGVSTGGVYAFLVGTGNRAFGIQPGGSDWTPGTAILRFQNKTGGVLTDLTISYKVYILNNENRGNSFNFSHSSDNSSYTDVTSLDLTSNDTADVSPSWKMYVRTVYISGLSIANDGYYYLRWSGDDVDGADNRDEFALDDIQLVANTTSVYPTISGTAEEVVLDGNTDLSDNLTIDGTLTLTSGILNTKDDYTLTLGENVANPTESETSNINGTIIIVKTVGTSAFHFFGCNMSAGDNIGILTLIRKTGSSGASTINNYNSIAESWQFSSTVSGSRNVTLSWHSVRDNGNNFSTEKSAQLYNYVSDWSASGNGKVISAGSRAYQETIDLSSTATKYSVAVPSTLTLYSQDFDTDNWSGTNNSQPDANWTNTPTTGNTSWRLNNQSSTNNSASWSYPVAGKIKSYGKTGYSAQFHTYGTANAEYGTFDLKLDFSPEGTKKLSFYYTNAKGSDILEVSLSTNNGVSFGSVLETFTTGSWDKKTVTLGTSTEQNCIIRFKATSDFGRDDIGIDNVEVYVERYSYTVDPGMLTIDMNQNYNTGTHAPQVTVKNYGTSTLSTFNVTMTITGGYSSTKTVTSLAADGTAQVTFDDWTPTAGSYTVSVTTELTSDQNTANNTLTTSVGISSGTWSDETNFPSANYLGSAVGYTSGLNKYLYVTGGVGTENKFYKYNESTDEWTTNLPDITAGKTVHASAIVGDYLYVIGGADNGEYQTTVYRFNLTNEGGNWETMEPLPKSIGWCKAVSYGQYIYVVGGFTNEGGAQALGDVYVYNTSDDTWSAGTSLNDSKKRFGGALSIVGDKLVYVAGASSSSTLTNEVLIGQITGATTISWSVSSMPYPGNGEEVIIPSGINLASLEFPKKNIKSEKEGDELMSVYPAGSLYCLDAAPWGDNSIIVAGGTDGVDGNPVEPSLCYAFDLTTWSPKQNLPTPIYGSGMGTVYDDTNWYMLLASGYTINGTTNKTQKFLVPLSGEPPRPMNLNLISGLEGSKDTDNPPQMSVTVEIRQSTTPYSIVDTKTILQNEAGLGTAVFNNVDASKPYYLVVRYENGLETWSAEPQYFVNGQMNYDFTTAQTQAYGNNMVKIGDKWCIISGDIDQDGKINAMTGVSAGTTGERMMSIRI
ncbi:MAG: kelch repeat-containing protein [Ignavibacteria bacterium]